MHIAMRVVEDRTEVHFFRPWVIIGIPVAALMLQAYLPLWLPRASALDLPLLITVYFASSRRNPIIGLSLGAIIGLAQDALGSGPVGVFGMVKTVIGYLASSLGARLDVDHPLSRLLLIFGFYMVHKGLFLLLEWILLDRTPHWPGWNLPLVALVNAFTGVIIFQLLDRFRQKE